MWWDDSATVYVGGHESQEGGEEQENEHCSSGRRIQDAIQKRGRQRLWETETQKASIAPCRMSERNKCSESAIRRLKEALSQ